MYPVSNDYKNKIAQPYRIATWYGTVTDNQGTSYEFDSSSIRSGSGSVTRACSSSTSLDIGSVYAGELNITLMLDVDRYLLYGGSISLMYRLYLDDAMETYEEIPMGTFTISEATRTIDDIKITAYDNMLKFDVPFVHDTTARTPYEWLSLWCSSCGVTLGTTPDSIYTMPNGTRLMAFATGVADDIDTYRDALSYLATALCAVAFIDRDGRLVLRNYSTVVSDTISASHRYSSSLSDFQTYYTGLYATYVANSESEYYHVSGQDDGLVINIGANPFLQFTTDANRRAAIQSIINKLGSVMYAPYSVTMPCNPAYDPIDVIKFTGNQASSDDLGAITEITIKINGQMTIRCGGENPKLTTVESRESKVISSLASAGNTSVGGTSFWMIYDTTAENPTVSDTAIVENTIQFKQSTDYQKVGILWTGAYTLTQASIVTAYVYIDNVLIYSFKALQCTGVQTLSINCPRTVAGASTHTVSIYVKCEDTQFPEAGSDLDNADLIGY
jgi:hypothetical protein